MAWKTLFFSAKTREELIETLNRHGAELVQVAEIEDRVTGQTISFTAWAKRQISDSPDEKAWQARRAAATRVLHDQTLDPAERLDLAFKLALGEPAEKSDAAASLAEMRRKSFKP